LFKKFNLTGINVKIFRQVVVIKFKLDSFIVLLTCVLMTHVKKLKMSNFALENRII